MIAGALAYYQWNGWKNRLLARIRRMKQPKYLFGAIVGGFYFYWYFFRALAGGRGAHRFSPEYHDIGIAVGPVLLFAAMVLAWIIPHARAGLVFTPGEIAFLFPAPIGRKTLIHFKLLKSQFAILLSAVFISLFRWGGGNFLLRALGWWVILATMNLHMIGSSFARTFLLDRGFSNWQRRVLILGLVAAAGAALYIGVRNSLPPFPADSERGDVRVLGDYAKQVLASGPLPYVLLPFRMVVAPYFASDAGEFLRALGPALLIIALHYWWVVSSDVAFEETSLELSQKVADRRAAMRAGNWQAAQKKAKPVRSPFQLRSTGLPAVALFWKNLASAGSMFTRRMLFILIWIIVITCSVVGSPAKHGGGGEVIAFVTLAFAGMSLFWGPQILRNDLRQDLPATDVLKMYPLPGWQVVLGELLAPAAILAGAQWLALLASLFTFPNNLGSLVITPGERIGGALAAALVLPCIDLMAMIIPNAAVLFFPAWFQLGKDGPRGFENTGQQLILMVGQLLVLALALLPATAGFAAVFFLGMRLLPIGIVVALGGLVAAILLLVEAGLAISLLGKVFERFDLSGELLQQE